LYDYLYNLAIQYPEKNFLILSGHTHQPAKYEILPNLTIKVGVPCLGDITQGEFINI
jgi:hypothetical protein